MREKLLQKANSLIKKGFFHILLGGTLTKIIAFFSSILIVRFVSKTEYAYLSYADNILSYVYLVCGLGLDSAILKFCVSDDAEKNRGLYFYAAVIGSAVSVLISLLAVVLCRVIPVPFPESRPFLTAMVAYPLLYFWLCISQGFMRARLMNRQFAYAGIVQALTVLVVSLLLVRKIGAYSLVAARYTAAFLALSYVIYCISSELKGAREWPDSKKKREVIRFGVSLLIANVFSMIMPINETFLVNNLIKDAVVTANYKVANLIPQQLPFVTSAIITFYFPLFAKMSDKQEIWERSKKVGVFTAAAIFVTAAIGILVSPLIIRLAYGNKYSDVNGLMSALWLMHACNAGIRMLPMNILPAVGYTKFNVYVSVGACFVHFAVDYLCISNFGVNGAVIAGFIVYLLTSAAYWIYLRKKMRENDNEYL